MLNTLNPFLLCVNFEQNCRVRVRADHFFTDKRLFTNMFGLTFFDGAESGHENPHISPVCRNMPGILDEYFSDGLPEFNSAKGNFEIRDAITAMFPKKFRVEPEKNKNPKAVIDCAFPGRIERENGVFSISYGIFIPTTIYVTGEDTLCANLPFSPFPSLSFALGKRVLHTVDYPVDPNPLSSNTETVTVDFAVTTKNLEIAISNEFSGRIALDYSIEVGVTTCEVSKIVFEFSSDNAKKTI